jgi:hypothetical protein
MSENYSETEKLEILIAAAVKDADRGSQGLFNYYEDPDAFFNEDSRGLFGISFDELLTMGKGIWEKMSLELQPVFCDKNDKQHKVLAGLIEDGSEEVIPAIASVITASVLSMGVIPAGAITAVTYFLVKLILKKFFTATLNTGCEKWKEYNGGLS